MDKVIALLYQIKERPGIYLEKKSIYNLKIFLNGYYIAQYENDRDFCSLLDSFQNFIGQKYKENRTIGWADMILAHSQNDSSAFDTFFVLLEEYLSQYVSS